MIQVFKGAAVASVMAIAMLATGCSTTKVAPERTTNPAPAEAFASFGRLELRPAVFMKGVSGSSSGLEKLNESIKKELADPMAEWNARPGNGRKLIIEPVVEQMKTKYAASRAVLGPLAGNSEVLVRMNIKDNTGRVIATPEFVQKVDAKSAGWTLGKEDDEMLTRVATLSASYIKANFFRALGGPTGAVDPAAAGK